MNKFRIRKWLKLQHQKEIAITADTYQHIGEYNFIKLIITGSNNGWLITVHPEVFEVIQSPYDKDSTANVVKNVIAVCRKQYISRDIYIKHPLQILRHPYRSMRKKNKRHA